jgi:glycosyltransferase involved in cell wall biosynthesis
MKLSVILPVYNEEDNIKKGTIDKVLEYLTKKKWLYEVLIVDDGSSDKTIPLIKKKYLPNKYIRIVEKHHEGKAYSVIAGIKHATGDVLFFTDFDLATPIEELEKIINEIENGNDVVIGSRSGMRKGAPLTRKILSKGMVLVRDVLVGLGGLRDTQCGFKGFKKQPALAILEKFRVFKVAKEITGPSVSAAFDLEFLFIAKKLGYKIKEVPVAWRHVESRNVSFLRDAYESMMDILRIKFYSLMGKYNV